MTVNVTNYAFSNQELGVFIQKVIGVLESALPDASLSNVSGNPIKLDLREFNQPAKIDHKEYFMAIVGINCVKIFFTRFDHCTIQTNDNEILAKIEKAIKEFDEKTGKTNRFDITPKSVKTIK